MQKLLRFKIKYGHSVYFNRDKQLIGVWSCEEHRLYNSKDKEWEHVKFAFRSSLITDITLRQHLAYNHLVIANSMMIASRETLNKDHPIRRLLKPHYYRSANINWSAKSILIPTDQLAHRTWGFTHESWNELLTDVFSMWKYQPFNEFLVNQNISELPLKEDGQDLWNVIELYVKSYLNIHFTPESIIKDNDIIDFWNHHNKSSFNYGLPDLTYNNIVNYLTNSIWWVTGGHELVGSIVEYLVYPNGYMPKICKGKITCDVQTFAQTLIIISLTGIKQVKLIDNWTHLFEDNEKECVSQFNYNLKQLSNVIEERNKNRPIKFNVCNPSVLESSVSI